MESKLYVGNLSYDTTEDDLRQLFSEAGAVVSATIITDRETKRSKGFGFIEMQTQADAEKAVRMFNGRELHNRQLRVDVARPRADHPGGSGGKGRDQRGRGSSRRY